MASAANGINLHVHIYIKVTSHEHWNISSHRSLDFLLKSVFRVTSKKTETRKAMRHVTGIYAGNLPVTGGFSTRRPNNKECVFMSWSYHDFSYSLKGNVSLFRTQRLDWLINDELSTKLGDYRSEIEYTHWLYITEFYVRNTWIKDALVLDINGSMDVKAFSVGGNKRWWRCDTVHEIEAIWWQ